MSSFLQKECDLKFFHKNGFIRKKCSSCGAHYWTLDKDSKFCGDQPCVKFSFIGKPFGKKSLSLSEVRESFLSFFEKNGHSRISYPETGERCPVVARWRTDIYLTIASIADFQPHVTSGEVPPPANPLVISQPCIRLNDLEEVGVSGRHLTTFEMMGHHAFNKNIDEIYFKEETVRFCDKYFVEEIGIPREAINYKEELWFGGGNAGPCLEVIAAGLEIATLVFMNMKEDEKGYFEIEGKKYSPNPLNIVDTGYGLERISWITQGTETVYETAFPEMIKWLKEHAKGKSDLTSIYSLADHTKCLSFMLGDGIVPSNVKSGYLARLIIRRSLRFIEKIGLKTSLRKLVDMQVDFLGREFPSLKQRKKQIGEILDIEEKRYSVTLSKGESFVKRILKEKKTIDENELISLYDTHGMQPEIVKNIAKSQGVNVKIPENFESMVAELHSHEKKDETTGDKDLDLPKTDQLYYKDHYTKEFDAKVLWKNGSEIILDKTAFYPEGGGQIGDIGYLSNNGNKITVICVKKSGNSIIHVINGNLDVGDKVHGKIDWDRRYILMKHHTGTHLINGALRKLLGEHVWQAGSQLELNNARFDYAHYKPLSESEKKEIEKLANNFIKQAVKVEKKVLDRNSAEKMYGFRLYQGGVPPGNSIRVINLQGIDVEACGGTHLNNSSEVEKIRIIKTERIQDGVNRIIFAAGKMADVHLEEERKQYEIIINNLSSTYTIKNRENISEQLKKASEIFSVQINQLNKTLERFRKMEELNLIRYYENLNKSYKDFKKIQKAIQPSIQLKEALKLSEKRFNQLQKAIQPSIQLQKATARTTKQYAEQFKNLQKAIQPSIQLQKATARATKQYAEQFKNLQKAIQPSIQLQKATARATKQYAEQFQFASQNLAEEIKRINKERMKTDLVAVSNYLFEQWKKTRKDKKKVTSNEIEKLINKAETIPGTKIKIVSSRTSLEGSAVAGAITEKNDYVAHIFDGNKLVSMVSGNVKIDLREIAPEIGKILGGSGGGKPNMTQCGGPNKDKIDKALELAKQLTKKKLKK